MWGLIQRKINRENDCSCQDKYCLNIMAIWRAEHACALAFVIRLPGEEIAWLAVEDAANFI